MKKFRFTLASGTKLTIHPPTVRQYYIDCKRASDSSEICEAISGIISRNDEGLSFTAEEIMKNFTADDLAVFITAFPAWIKDKKESDPALRIPYYPSGSGNKTYFQCVSGFRKIAADYCNCSLNDIYSMDIFDYWEILHDAVVWNRSSTEEGREYLENAYMYMQEKPDRETAQKIFGGNKKSWQKTE